MRFCSLLQACKRTWNNSQPKYSTFWDAEAPLKQLKQTPLDWNSIVDVRNRLIITCRLLNLSRSIDLARTWRCHSQVGQEFYILTQRKNQKRPHWETLVSLDDNPDLSPKHLMLRYVKLTAHLVPNGSLLLRLQCPPFTPLCANTIGSITRKMLQNLGIATKLWGPHSTRGAGVKFYKKLGLTSEEVCEIGRWKNTSAFTTHYLRIGAAASASKN